jgi:hypothetical protein
VIELVKNAKTGQANIRIDTRMVPLLDGTLHVHVIDGPDVKEYAFNFDALVKSGILTQKGDDSGKSKPRRK